jgi:hypothetical protein
MPLRLRRGTNAERLTITPLEGELIYTTDTKKVYVGDGNTIGGTDMVSTAGGFLSGNLNLDTFSIEGAGSIDIIGDISNGTITLSGDTISSSTNSITFGNKFDNGTLTLDGNFISSNDTFIASGSGNTIGILKLSEKDHLLQIQREWNESVEPVQIEYGITNGFFSLLKTKNTSRGTIDTPLTVVPGDCLSFERTLGYDGFDYVISSAIWQGVDPSSSVTAGSVPGAIALITLGPGGQKVASFDSNGYFGINKFPTNATEALDVDGSGLFTGSVSAAAFKGSFFADDSTLLVDGMNGTISNGTITLNQDRIESNSTFISPFSGNTIGILELSSPNNPLQIRRFFNESVDPYEVLYGVSDGFSSLSSSRYSSRGTTDSPLALTQGDTISSILNFGWDGTNYSLSSGIRFGVDFGTSVTTGIVPGSIIFVTTSTTGSFSQSLINSDGYFGILSGTSTPEAPLDVYGDAIIRGKAIIKNPNSGTSYETVYGTTTGFSGLDSTGFTSRGTIETPTSVNLGDTLKSIVNFGHDGSGFAFSSAILFGVDPAGTLSPGNVPGAISFLVQGADGIIGGGFDSRGYFSIRKSANTPIAEALEVNGNALVTGTVSAASFNGSVISNDSLVVFDDATGAVQGSTVTSQGYVQFGSYDSAGRSALTPANGMVIYNTTANRFQGYQASAWINLDDGTAAP